MKYVMDQAIRSKINLKQAKLQPAFISIFEEATNRAKERRKLHDARIHVRNFFDIFIFVVHM